MSLCFFCACNTKYKQLPLSIEQSTESIKSAHESHADHDFLIGHWQGEVINNSSDPSGGGKPTLGETGTELKIHLFKSEHDIEGVLSIGQVEEKWRFTHDQHVWMDGSLEVHTKEVPSNQLPVWIKQRIDALKLKNATMVAYDFLSCKRLKDEKPCEVKKDVSVGLKEQGYWVFMVQDALMYVNVYYLSLIHI